MVRQLIRSLYLCVGLFLVSGCEFSVLSLGSLTGGNSTPDPLVVDITSGQNGVSPIAIAGGTAPYSVRIADGVAEVDLETNELIATVPGTVTIEVTDVNGQVALKQVVISQNLSVQSGASETSMRVTSDFTKVFYIKSGEVYRVNADGSGSTKVISVPQNLGGDIIDSITAIQLTPNDQKIVFTGSDATDFYIRLYSANADGTGIVRLSGNYVDPGQSVFTFDVVSNNRVVYRDGEQETMIGDVEQWARTVALDGSGRTTVHPTIVGNSDSREIRNYAYNASKTKLFYFTETGVVGNGLGDTILYVSNTDGSDNSTWNRISPAATECWSGSFQGIRISPDESRIAFMDDAGNLQSCQTDGLGCVANASSLYPIGFAHDNIHVLAYTSPGFNTKIVSSVTGSSQVLAANGIDVFLVKNSNFVFQRSSAAAGNSISRTALTAQAPPSWNQIVPSFGIFSTIAEVKTSDDGSKLYFIVDDQTITFTACIA